MPAAVLVPSEGWELIDDVSTELHIELGGHLGGDDTAAQAWAMSRIENLNEFDMARYSESFDAEQLIEFVEWLKDLASGVLS